jgi:biopolymer transport protein ExbD
MRRPVAARPRREPTIALINVVFLMLVFFLVAGTLAQPLDPSLQLIRTAELEGHAPPDALVIHPDGRLIFRGRPQSSAALFLQALPPAERAAVRIVPDRALPAVDLMEIVGELRAAGARRIVIVTERGPG